MCFQDVLFLDGYTVRTLFSEAECNLCNKVFAEHQLSKWNFCISGEGEMFLETAQLKKNHQSPKKLQNIFLKKKTQLAEKMTQMVFCMKEDILLRSVFLKRKKANQKVKFHYLYKFMLLGGFLLFFFCFVLF